MASFDPPLYYFNGINFNSGYYETGNTSTTSTASGNYLPLTGGTLTGALNGTSINAINFVENGTALSSKYLGLTGGTVAGRIDATILNGTAISENFIDLQNKYLQLSGGTLTNTLNGTTINATSFVENGTALSSKYLAIAGGTLTGGLIISAGNVGIGTLIPTTKVDVVGDIKASANINAITNLQENSVNLSSKYLQLSGGTLTGALTGTTITGTSFVEGATALSSKYLQLSGGTLTGALTGTTINATSFVENGTALSSKYLQIGGGPISGNIFFSTGVVGIGTTSATGASLLNVGNIVNDRDIYNHSLSPATITNQVATGTTTNDQQPVLNLCRQGMINVAYGARSSFKISRWENNLTHSRTRLDISLAHTTYNDINILSLRSDGRVGINQIVPTVALDVVGDIKASATINATTNLQENGVNLSSKYLNLSGGTLTNTLNGTTINATTNLQEGGTSLSSKYLRLSGGTITGALVVDANTVSTGFLAAHADADLSGYYPLSGATYNDICATFNSSIWCKSAIIISSDERIKKDIQDINDDSALQKILSIQPKTYKYIDRTRGTSNVYGFIAQQIKEVIPEAVSIQKEYIPDIYDICNYSSNIITTSNINISNLLNTSNLVKIYDDTGKEYKCKVNEILSSNSFTIDTSEINSSNVFLYGKEINDFNALDKSYIYTLNVCATQQIHALVMELQNKITTLETRLNILEGN
jgi:hypothetical protein